MAGSVAINKLIQITPHNFEMERVDNSEETATITPPCAHVGPGPVQIRLLSFVEREGQVGTNYCLTTLLHKGNELWRVMHKFALN